MKFVSFLYYVYRCDIDVHGRAACKVDTHVRSKTQKVIVRGGDVPLKVFLSTVLSSRNTTLRYGMEHSLLAYSRS